VSAVDAGRCLEEAAGIWRARVEAAAGWHVVAAGKAASPMLRACLAAAPVPPASALLVGPARDATLPASVDQQPGGHPGPTDGSVAAGMRALDVAAATSADQLLLVLLSGGASAMLAVPADAVALTDKQAVTAALLRGGADIFELNAVRKHLSRVKGGRLAAAAAGETLCLAVSDVIGDDLSVIGSGPCVGDPTTYADALAVLDRRGGRGAFPAAVVAQLERGAAGRVAETPKPGAPELRRATTRVIGNLGRALLGAKAEAARRGFDVAVETEVVTGEARTAAARYAERTLARRPGAARPLCIISGGETTVHVVGRGRGGRNQEFALALAGPLAASPRPVVAVSLGTDGIDGPTDAAGAVVDSTTRERASVAVGRSLQSFLDDNDAYSLFRALGDLVITGPTGTNVGDIQVTVLAPGDR